MKKIFDWMCEEVNATIGVELFGEEYTGIKRVNRIINEAEAKWESKGIPIIHGKAELELHDAEIRQQAITDFVEHITLPLTTEEDIARILEQLEVK